MRRDVITSLAGASRWYCPVSCQVSAKPWCCSSSACPSYSAEARGIHLVQLGRAQPKPVAPSGSSLPPVSHLKSHPSSLVRWPYLSFRVTWLETCDGQLENGRRRYPLSRTSRIACRGPDS